MNILVICGPTASGKTSLALSIARKLITPSSLRGGSPTRQSHTVNILSVDSRQVYKGLDLVTGKDIPKDLSPSIKIFGLDLIDPDQSINLAEFVQFARQVIADSIKEKTPLIIVGGTGLYLKGITSNLLNVNVPPNQKLRNKLEKLDTEELKKILLELNPEKYNSLNNSDVNNPRRLVRAIEIAKSSPSVIARNEVTRQSPPTFIWAGLRPDQETQKQNIHQRVLDRLENGALQEARDLIQNYPNPKLPIYTSLGVKEIIQFLNNQISKEELINLWTTAEMDYARRQMVWFKKQPDIIWYDKDRKILANQLAKIFQNND